VLATMSESCPVDGTRPRLERDGLFLVCRGYSEAVDVLTDPRMQSNFARYIEGAGITEGRLWEAARSGLLSLNGPDHVQARSLVSALFTPRAVERVRMLHRVEAENLADALGDRGPVDFVSDFANPYTTTGACHFFGFDPTETESIHDLVLRFAHCARNLPSSLEEFTATANELLDLAESVVDRRRPDPGHNVIGQFANAVENGETSLAVAAAQVSALLSAGHEPVTNQLCLMVNVLAENHHLWDSVADDEAHLVPVLEEVLRHQGTNMGTTREATLSFDFGETSLKDHELVFVSIDDANHDPLRYRHPQQMDPEANGASHLAFGVGAHYCLGASLARLQLQEALKALTHRFHAPRIVEREFFQSGGLRGLDVLKVELQRRTP
jgi:cytochrome P450